MIAFPLAPADWQDQVPFEELSFSLSDTMQSTRTAGGDVILDEVGEPHWTVQMTFGKVMPWERSGLDALIDLVKSARGPVFLTPPLNRAPQADPGGSILGAATPTLTGFDRDAATVTISGLPAGYVLRRGDFFSVTFGPAPEAWSLHRIAETEVTADGGGTIADVSIEPNLPRSFAGTPALRLIDPVCLAVMDPGSVEPGSVRRGVASGGRLRMISTLRPSIA